MMTRRKFLLQNLFAVQVVLVLLSNTYYKASTFYIESFQIGVIVHVLTPSTRTRNNYYNSNNLQRVVSGNKNPLLYLSDFNVVDYGDDDDDEIVLGKRIDRRSYAEENDTPEMKASVGLQVPAPIIERDAEPLFVPAGSQLELDEDTVIRLISACRLELGTLFGYSTENRGVGITGRVEFVELDGGVVVLSLAGRYWHQRTTVLDRVANYLQQRIPEIIDVTVIDPYQLTDEANNEAF